MSSPQQPPQQPGYGAPQWSAGQQQPYAQGYGQPAPQQPYAQGQPAPQQPYGGLPTGELVLNLQKPFGAMGMISPVVRIDGYPAVCQWGRNAFPVPAGGHQLEVAQSYLWTYGQATLPVVIEPGRSSEIYYAGPMFTFGVGGSIGTGPQKRRGMGVFIGLMVFVAVCVLIGILSAIIGNS